MHKSIYPLASSEFLHWREHYMIPRALGCVRVRLERLGASGEVGIIRKQRRVPFFGFSYKLFSDERRVPLVMWFCKSKCQIVGGFGGGFSWLIFEAMAR